MPPVKSLRIAIFISGRGSNMEKILENIKNGFLKGVEVALVVSDKKEAEGLSVAKKYGVANYIMNIPPHRISSIGKEEEANIARYLKNLNVQLICLAGFMRLIKHDLLHHFKNRIINIHPSLLPQYPGLETHRRVIENKEKKTGASVHVVDAGMDTGIILEQIEVDIDKEDTPETLQEKVLKKEHILYSEVIRKIRDEVISLPIDAPSLEKN